MFQTIVAPISYREAIDQGYLLPPRIYEPDRPNLKGIKRTGGDYNRKDLAKRLAEDPTRVGSLVENWLEFGEGARTLCFATSIEDSHDIVRRFKFAGVRAEHLDGDTNETLRDAVLARLESGETQLVCNVDVLVEGYDLPSLGCIILAAPTCSLTRYLQMVGRGSRPFETMQYFVILDHAGCVAKLGDPTADRDWTLEDRKQKKDTEGEMITCPECMLMRPANVFHCPQCIANKTASPWQASMFGGLPIEVEGRLVERQREGRSTAVCCNSCRSESVTLEPYGDLKIRVKCRGCNETTYQVDRVAAKLASTQRRADELMRLEAVREAKGFKPSWVTHAYRETFGEPPPAPKESA
jgi:superfamily II DNA or RNA helicase